MRLLVVDIGNTNIVLSVNEENIWSKPVRILSNATDCIDSFKLVINELSFDRAVISSVVPKLTESIRYVIENVKHAKTVVVGKSINLNLDKSTMPDELGSDLICNMIEAHYLYPDKLVTIADFGTAFTTSTVDSNGRVLGVTIAPGIQTSINSLFAKTAQLPEINFDVPKSVLGKNSIDSIRSGLVYGYVGQIKEIVKQIKKETGQDVFLVMTGGFCEKIAQFVDCADKVDIWFTLKGAKIAALMNV